MVEGPIEIVDSGEFVLGLFAIVIAILVVVPQLLALLRSVKDKDD